MAVVLNIARINDDERLACSSNVGSLQSLLSYKFIPKDRYLDLNWYGWSLERAVLLVFGEKVASTLQIVFDCGDELLNKAYPEGPWDDTVDSKIVVSNSGRISKLVCELGPITLDIFRIAVKDPANPIEIELSNIERLVEEIASLYSDLLRFLVEAEKNEDSVVAWWD